MKMQLLDLQHIQGLYLERSKNFPKSEYDCIEWNRDKVVFNLNTTSKKDTLQKMGIDKPELDNSSGGSFDSLFRRGILGQKEQPKESDDP